MDIFHRSHYGIINSHLLADVDCIVYVEGGSESYTLDEVKSGKYSKCSSDVIFWSGLFRLLDDGKSYEFRSVGSCVTLESMLIEIGDNRRDNVKICMDRDRKEFWGEIHSSPYYTRCYAWENELFNREVVAETFFLVNQVSRAAVEDELYADIDRIIAEAKQASKWVVHADVALGGLDESLFDRTKVGSSLDMQGPAPYKFALYRLYSRLKQKIHLKKEEFSLSRKHVAATKADVEENSMTYCFGHLVSKAFYHLIEWLSHKHGLWVKLNFVAIETIAINQFLAWLGANKTSNEYLYYKAQFQQA